MSSTKKKKIKEIQQVAIKGIIVICLLLYNRTEQIKSKIFKINIIFRNVSVTLGINNYR